MFSERCRLSAVGPLGTLALVALAGSLVGSAAQVQEPRTGGSRDQVLYVSVVTRNGTPVHDIRLDEFIVREDGVLREALRVEKADDPVTITLLVDNSAAAAPHIAEMRRGLQAFVERLGGKHLIALTTYGERPTRVVDYTLDRTALVDAVDRLFALPGSGAYALDAIAETSKRLAKREDTRSVLVVVSVPGEEFSELHHTNVLPLLARSGAALTALVIQGRVARMTDGQQSLAMVFDRGVRESGGTNVPLLTSMALTDALNQFADQLVGQYRLTYARRDTLIPPTKVEVTVRRPGLLARGTPARAQRG